MCQQSKLRLVRLDPSRWREVARLEAQCFPHPWDPGTVRQVLNTPSCRGLGAEDPETGRLVGHALYAAQGALVHVLDLAVAPGWRRRQVATRLVAAVEAEARDAGAGTLFLEAREQNEAAQAFYRKLGFAFAGRKPGYYRDTGEDAFVLVKEIGPGHE